MPLEGFNMFRTDFQDLKRLLNILSRLEAATCAFWASLLLMRPLPLLGLLPLLVFDVPGMSCLSVTCLEWLLAIASLLLLKTFLFQDVSTVIGVPPVVGVPAVADVAAVVSIHAVVGVYAVAGIPAFDGVLADVIRQLIIKYLPFYTFLICIRDTYRLILDVFFRNE